VSVSQFEPDLVVGGVVVPGFLRGFVGGGFRLSWSWWGFVWGPWRYVWAGLYVKVVLYVGLVSQLGWFGVGWWWVLVLHVLCGLLFRFDLFRLLVFDERVWGVPGLRLLDGSFGGRVGNVLALRRAGWLSEGDAVVLLGELRRLELRERRLDALRMALSVGVLAPAEFRDEVREVVR
jgi:hypothetical protein